ncbi:MAG: hypothetical protein AAGA80_10170 [Cyanobacteria bacterium P01_F01_bin.143]
MAILTDIGQLITKDPHGDRPVITVTRTSIWRIAGLYNQGNNAEEIATGIILGFQSYSIGEQMRRILRIIATKSAEDMKNQVEFLSA